MYYFALRYMIKSKVTLQVRLAYVGILGNSRRTESQQARLTRKF